MTEEFHQLWYNTAIDEDVNVWIVFSTDNFTGSSIGCIDFHVSSPLLIPDIYKKKLLGENRENIM